MATSPTVRRRRLGGRLRSLRQAAGMTIDQVAEATGVSRSVLSRIETGASAPKAAALTQLLAFYTPPPEVADELTRLARESRKRGWWNAGGGDDLLEEVRTLVGLETEASMIEEYSGQVVNGLLQIPDYSRALLQGALPDPDEESIAAAMAYRVKRQERLKDLDLSVIIPEEVLLRRVGGATVMARQLQHLLEVSHSHQVTLQILDLEAGSHPGIGGAFSIIIFPEGNGEPAVYLEGTDWDALIEDAARVAVYRRRFSQLRTDALNQPDSRARIHQRMKELES